MSRIQFLLLMACLAVVSTGCRSNKNNGMGGWLSNNCTVPPPPTYSLNIPSVAKNQPYYAPGTAAPGAPAPNGATFNPVQPAPTTAPNGATFNPVQPAPTTAPNGATFNPVQPAPTTAQQSPAWRQTGAGGSSGAPASASPVLTSPTTFVETQANPGVGGAPARTAAVPGAGYSYNFSPNYQSTQTDESRDSTRLPVSDATAVRAPSQFNPTLNPNQYPGYPAGYRPPAQQTFVAQNGTQPPQSYTGTMQIVGQPTGYQGQGVLVNPNQPGAAPNVQAQSTATTTGNSGQVGWRTREMTSDSVNQY